MNSVKKVQTVIFSPTGTTRKVVESISKGIGVEQAAPIDLTQPKNRSQWKGRLAGDLIIVGVPTYYDTIPSMILSQLNRLQGNGKWVVVVTVYGNVSPGSCLQELCGLLQNRGFKVLAAASFIGEHSFTNDEAPLASGRPDEKDLVIAIEFGHKIREKLGTRLTEAPIQGIQLKIGHDYHRKPEEYPEKDVINLAKIDYNEAVCTRCLNCVNSCPTGAIDHITLAVDDGLCMRCFACTRACPTMARRPSLISDIVDFFKSIQDKRQEPTIIL